MTDPIDSFLSWLIAMDDPDSAEGMAARQTVTLTNIIRSARDVQRWMQVAKTTEDGGLDYLTDSAPRLWEVDHPYYGADGYENKVESFEELRAAVDGMDEDMNLVYRWDWKDYSQPQHDDLFVEGEYRGRQEFTVYWLMPRKERCGSTTCPITHEQEAEVIEWLRGPRCAGHLRRVWEPILGQVPNA
jgi:hypothetical protein